MSDQRPKAPPIPFPLGGIKTNEQEAEWLESTLALRMQEALYRIGIQARMTTMGMRELLLLSLNKASERAKRTMAEDHFVPGKMRCPGCGFTCQHIRMSAIDGSCGDGTREPGPCPNGCGLLSSQTWHTEALELGERLAEVYEEKQLAHTLIARLHHEGFLSEGQCCSALDMDRVEFRTMVDARVPG